METKKNQADDEAKIRQLIDNWAKALRAKDVNRLMSHYAPGILVFDLAPPLQYVGTDAYRKNWEAWFPSFQGPVGYEVRDLSIATGNDVAFSHSLNRISGTRTNGEETDVWVRATVGFCKSDGNWMITHEHISVPFYMEPPFKASLDLKP